MDSELHYKYDSFITISYILRFVTEFSYNLHMIHIMEL